MFTSPKRAEATPLTKLEPVLLVKTFNPSASRSSTIIFVVVVFPFVPLITKTPLLREDKVLLMKSGSIFSTNNPGKADPPPFNLATFLTAFPSRVVYWCLFIIKL